MSESFPPGPTGPSGPPERADRVPLPLGPTLVGAAAGLVAFVFLVSAGLLLYQRLYGDSVVALVVILVLFGGLGSYLAWLLAVLTFSRVRRPEEGDGAG